MGSTKLLDAVKDYGVIVFGNFTEGSEGKTAMLREVGSIEKTSDFEALITSHTYAATFPVNMLPIDWTHIDAPKCHKYQIGFEAWLHIPEDGNRLTKQYFYTPYKYREETIHGVYDKILLTRVT